MTTNDFEHLQNKEKRAVLCSLVKVESTREFKNSEKPTEKATRYDISSLEAEAQDFQKAIRSHWAIENKLLAFAEDASPWGNEYMLKVLKL